jgi:hypothetical protein
MHISLLTYIGRGRAWRFPFSEKIAKKIKKSAGHPFWASDSCFKPADVVSLKV